MSKTKKQSVVILCECAVMLALASVLSLIPFFKMPLGGSVTLFSMLPIVIISVRHGLKWGLGTAFVYSLIQLFLDLGALLSWGLTPTVFIGSLLLDYIVAFTVLGISGIWRNKGKTAICLGIVLALILRFLSHFVSGVILFACWDKFNSPVIWSIAYNGTFMLPELAMTLAATIILLNVPATKKYILGIQ